jgi:hypothetical protein
MHNVTADQIEKNKQLIRLVKNYPQIYNHDPTMQQSGESVEEIWSKIGAELQETCKEASKALNVCLFIYLHFSIVLIADSCKKKWRLLRSSLIRYIKVFKDKSTSKGNRYRPYYLLEHMDFLLPFIQDDKNIIRKVKPIIKAPQTPTMTVVKKARPEETQETILYTSTPNTITYSVQTVASSSKDSSSQDMKNEVQTQDIQQFYNHAGVKIIGEDYITAYPGSDGSTQLIYQSNAQTVEELQQQQQQECIQHEAEQQECQQDSPSKQQMTNATIIPIPNVSNVFSSTNPNEASDLYFLIGLLPDFRNLSHDTKRKVKIGILKLLDDAVSQ